MSASRPAGAAVRRRVLHLRGDRKSRLTLRAGHRPPRYRAGLYSRSANVEPARATLPLDRISSVAGPFSGDTDRVETGKKILSCVFVRDAWVPET
jgi:hypothetical protein